MEEWGKEEMDKVLSKCVLGEESKKINESGKMSVRSLLVCIKQKKRVLH